MMKRCASPWYADHHEWPAISKPNKLGTSKSSKRDKSIWDMRHREVQNLLPWLCNSFSLGAKEVNWAIYCLRAFRGGHRKHENAIGSKFSIVIWSNPIHLVEMEECGIPCSTRAGSHIPCSLTGLAKRNQQRIRHCRQRMITRRPALVKYQRWCRPWMHERLGSVIHYKFLENDSTCWPSCVCLGCNLCKPGTMTWFNATFNVYLEARVLAGTGCQFRPWTNLTSMKTERYKLTTYPYTRFVWHPASSVFPQRDICRSHWQVLWARWSLTNGFWENLW